MKRPLLTRREAALLRELQVMKGWVIHHLEPVLSGKGPICTTLRRDMDSASKAVSEATGGNEA